MATLSRVASLLTDISEPGGTLDFSGLSDMIIYEEAGEIYLLTAAEATGRLQVLSLAAHSAPTLEDHIDYSATSGTDTVGALNFFTISGQNYVLPSGRYDDHGTLISVNGNSLGTPSEISGDALDYANFTHSLTVNFSANDFIVAAHRNEAGLTIYDIENDQSMNVEVEQGDDANLALMDISALAMVENGNSAFIYTASAIDDGIDVFSLGRFGAFNHIDTIRPWEVSGFDAIQDMLTIDIEGQSFLFAAAAGTSSITSYLVHQSGNLFEQDHVIDDLTTRFDGVSDLAHVRDGWRDFIVAGGSDDGITVFEIFPNGMMDVVATVADDFDTSLQNVSVVEAAVVDGKIIIIAGSNTEHGITQFEFTPDPFVNRYIASDVQPPGDAYNVTIGSNQNDQLFGQQLSDHIKGGKGDDIIDGGLSRDWLRGGPGADRFIFGEDGSADQIDDYEHGIDIIDLSQYSLVNDMSDITLESRRWGGIVHVNDEMIILKTHNLERIELHEWDESHFIF